MTNLLKEYLNQIQPYPQRITYQLVFSHNPTDISVLKYDYHTFTIDNTTFGIVPNSLVYGQDNIVIPTDNTEYINDCLEHLISQNLINKYEYNKIILDDPCIPFRNILNEIQWKIHYLGYPKYISVYKYINGIITAFTTYPLTINIHQNTDGLLQGSGVNIEMYINPMDKLHFYQTY